MRIISGTYKGRVLRSVHDPRIRPATDRVKETIFNVLQNRVDLRGARVLDLFAGSGSLGFEALSRGAARVTFVDDWNKSVKAIEENARLLQCTDRCETIKQDVYKFLSRADGQFDLVFVDPPYKQEEALDLPDRIFEKGLVAPAGILIMEHTSHTKLHPDTHFKVALERTFGTTVVSFFTPTATNS
jgi:16S rRNA (guanine966-N2)-methyltransferase